MTASRGVGAYLNEEDCKAFRSDLMETLNDYDDIMELLHKIVIIKFRKDQL